MPQLESPALPNIKGSFGVIGASGFLTYGAFHAIGANAAGYGKHNGGSQCYASYQGNYGYATGMKASSISALYKDDHEDVTPYNFNVNIYVKV